MKIPYSKCFFKQYLNSLKAHFHLLSKWILKSTAVRYIIGENAKTREKDVPEKMNINTCFQSVVSNLISQAWHVFCCGCRVLCATWSVLICICSKRGISQELWACFIHNIWTPVMRYIFLQKGSGCRLDLALVSWDSYSTLLFGCHMRGELV